MTGAHFTAGSWKSSIQKELVFGKLISNISPCVSVALTTLCTRYCGPAWLKTEEGPFATGKNAKFSDLKSTCGTCRICDFIVETRRTVNVAGVTKEATGSNPPVSSIYKVYQTNQKMMSNGTVCGSFLYKVKPRQ